MNEDRVHPDLFTKAEAAAYLRQSDATCIDNLRAKKLLKGIRIGIEYSYTRRELDALIIFLEEQAGIRSDAAPRQTKADRTRNALMSKLSQAGTSTQMRLVGTL